ncbi:MAG: Gfo/Idh/MocA family oxidoreductase [Rhodobacteraceae bacterium]|jgi:predicted dehydrogenase|nr:Gfo/Idh/MocA family oxidoreductase [Paracoccaceae bacterium]
MRPVALAVCGAGLIGRRHLDAIDRAAGARLAAIVEPDPAAGVLAAARGVPWHPDLSDLPAGAAEGVILATPNAHHVAGALACIAAGLPVLVEKPLAADLAGARVIVAAAEAAGVPVAVGHHRRHNPLVAAARAAIVQGTIGTPVAVHAMFWLRKPDDYFDVPWRRQPGAGPVMVNLVHDIDLLRHLLGEIVAVTAASSSAARGHAVEETAVLLLRFASGVLGSASVSDVIPAPWSWEFSAGENPAYPAAGQFCYLIGGSRGALELPSGRLWHHPGAQGWWSPLAATVAPRPAGEPLVAQVEQFARVVRGLEEPLVPAREGLATLAVIEAVLASAREGRTVAPQR